jgi:hypothetical protein
MTGSTSSVSAYAPALHFKNPIGETVIGGYFDIDHEKREIRMYPGGWIDGPCEIGDGWKLVWANREVGGVVE